MQSKQNRCGETHLEFLSIDHIGGGGNLHRRQINVAGGVHIYRWLKKRGFPSGFRVLCFNCNLALGHSGYCPHGTVQVDTSQAITQNGYGHNSQQVPLFGEASQ